MFLNNAGSTKMSFTTHETRAVKETARRTEMPPELTVDTEPNAAADGTPRPWSVAKAPKTPIRKGLASEQVCLAASGLASPSAGETSLTLRSHEPGAHGVRCS